LRRADQAHTDDLLEMGTQLTHRGFLPQAGVAENSARTNINELRQGVEAAAGSVMGSEADALRYAQKELDDLTRQVEREMALAGTNSETSSGGGNGGNERRSNRLTRSEGQLSPGNASGARSTMLAAKASAPLGEDAPQAAENNSPVLQRGEANSSGTAQNGNGSETANDAGDHSESSSTNPQNGQGHAAARNNPEAYAPASSGPSRLTTNNSPHPPNDSSLHNGQEQDGSDRLEQLAGQLGAQADVDDGGPIMGNGYVNWSGRLHDIEQVLDPQDLRNQLATVRERVAVLRADYRERGRLPQSDVVRSQILAPMTQVRVWVQEELSRQENAASLVPLDRDPVPDAYAEAVRKYYEKLGSAQR
jgi:hypothetical protein